MPVDSDAGIFEPDKNKPLVLLLGGMAGEGVLGTLHAAGRQYKQKILQSKVDNWWAIRKYFDDYTIACVLLKLSPETISLIANGEYRYVSESLFERIGSVPNIVLVYEDILFGKLEAYTNIESFSEFRNVAITLFRKYNVRVMPYKRLAEMTILAQAFLSETEQHLVFRLYVPSGRIWSNESDKLLQLFRDYLSKVTNIKVRLNQCRTEKGIIYEIHSEEMSSAGAVGKEFSEFTHFMDLCSSDPHAAEEMLRGKDLEPKEVLAILSRYSKEAKRLSVDLKHERELKILSIRQRLESELVDLTASGINWSTVESLVNLAVPQITGVQGAILIDQESMRLPVQGTLTNLTINLNPQIVETVNGVLAREISGDQHLGPEPQQLLELIKQYGGDTARDLASSVHELEDSSAPSAGRLTAKQKLKKFLFDLGDRVEGVAVHILQSYIEKKLGL
jgi:hypothetical protein